MRKPIHDYMEFTDLKDMLNKTGEIYGDRPAYVFKTEEKGKFREITHKEFRDDINSLGTALIELGLKGKRVAVISDNRYEWGLVYLAVATGVGVIVPLDKALPDNEIESLMMRSEIEAIVYSKKYDEVMNRVREEKNTNVKYFISMDIEKNEKDRKQDFRRRTTSIWRTRHLHRGNHHNRWRIGHQVLQQYRVPQLQVLWQISMVACKRITYHQLLFRTREPFRHLVFRQYGDERLYH